MKTPRCLFGSPIAALLLAVTMGYFIGVPPAHAQDPRLRATVIRVVDGDTVKVRLDSGQISVRLHATDTPERNQPFGREARDELARLLPVGSSVSLEVTDQSDGYGRMVARIFRGDAEVGRSLIASGHAWVFRQYAEREDRDLCRLEHQARTAGQGLWSLPAPRRVAPWEWRRDKRGKPRGYTDWTQETAANCRANFRRTPDRMTPPRGGGIAPVALASVSDAPAAPRPGCDIKGNISGNGRIYHLPGSSAYARTRIDTSKGERWFCSESEARAAGWRPPR